MTYPKIVTGVVCICGSTRFKDEIMDANRRLTLDGKIVLAPGVFGHAGDQMTDEQKAKLDRLHLDKIDLANAVYVVNPGGYIGDSTRREIEYAERTHKPVTYLVPPEAGDQPQEANPVDLAAALRESVEAARKRREGGDH